jgi:hypothetical protein
MNIKDKRPCIKAIIWIVLSIILIKVTSYKIQKTVYSKYFSAILMKTLFMALIYTRTPLNKKKKDIVYNTDYVEQIVF